MFSWNKIAILSVVCNIYQLMEKSQPRHLLNRIFIEDFLVLIQHKKEDEFQQFFSNIKDLDMKKKHLDILNILEVEHEA